MVVGGGQHCGAPLAPEDSVRSYLMLLYWYGFNVSFFEIHRPDLPRPIKVNLALPIIFIVLCVTLVLLPSLKQPMNLVIGILITASGIPVYWLCIKWHKKPALYGRLSHYCERFCQLMFNTIFLDEKEV